MKAVKAMVAILAIGAAAWFVYHTMMARGTAGLNNQASALLDQNKFAEARDLLEQARLRDPGNPIIWKNLAIAYEGLKNSAKAIEAYERSIALNASQTDLRDHVAILKKNK